MGGSKSEDLDELCIRNMTLMNDYISINNDLERSLRSGWFNLSLVRKSLGYSHGLAAQIDERDCKPALTLSSLQPEDNNQSTKWKVIQLNQDAQVPKPKPFGVLSPKSAKDSTKDFVRAGELVAQLLTIRNELEYLSERIRESKTVETSDSQIEE